MTDKFIPSTQFIEKLPNICVDLELVSVYDMDCYSVPQLLYRLAQKINDTITNMEHNDSALKAQLDDLQVKLEYLLGEGLSIELQKIFEKMYADGTLQSLVEGAMVDIKRRLDNLEKLNYVGVESTDDLQTIINGIENEKILVINDIITLSKPLTLKNNLYIKGKGKLIFNTEEDYIFDFTGLSNIKIEGLTIEVNCQKPKTGYNSGIFKFDGSENITVKDTKISGKNIFIGKMSNISKNIKIEGNVFNTNASFGIFCDERKDVGSITTPGNELITIKDNIFNEILSALLVDADYIEIIGNTFNKCNAPIAMLKVKMFKVLQNTLISFHSNGICLGNGSDDIVEEGIVANNILDGGTTSNVHGINLYKQGGDGTPEGTPNLGNSRYITIEGNFVKKCGATGIFIYGNGYVTVNGNVLESNHGGGILINTPKGFGNVSITGNSCHKNGGAGIAGSIGSNATIWNENVAITGNVCTYNTGRGIYLAKLKNSVVSNNICNNNGNEGMFLNNITDTQILGNQCKGNRTSDTSEFNGNLVLSMTKVNGCIVKNNIADTYHSVTSYAPYILSDNIGGIKNTPGVFGTLTHSNEDTSVGPTSTINVPINNSSSWLSSQLLVSFSASRQASGDLTIAHQYCLAIVTYVRLGDTITIGDIQYLSQNTGTNKATITVVANADKQSLDITGNSGYQSTDFKKIGITPLYSGTIY